MSRVINLILVTLLIAAFGATGAVVAAAHPPPCAYTLSPPQLEGNRVTATVTLAGCAGAFRPALSVACVHVDGQDSQGQCTQARGPAAARVYFEPYQPGATYRSSGRGCGTLFEDMLGPECQLLGPINATL